MHGRCENITNPACLACVFPNKGGLAEVEVSKHRSSQPALLVFIAMTTGVDWCGDGADGAG